MSVPAPSPRVRQPLQPLLGRAVQFSPTPTAGSSRRSQSSLRGSSGSARCSSPTAGLTVPPFDESSPRRAPPPPWTSRAHLRTDRAQAPRLPQLTRYQSSNAATKLETDPTPVKDSVEIKQTKKDSNSLSTRNQTLTPQPKSHPNPSPTVHSPTYPTSPKPNSGTNPQTQIQTQSQPDSQSPTRVFTHRPLQNSPVPPLTALRVHPRARSCPRARARKISWEVSAEEKRRRQALSDGDSSGSSGYGDDHPYYSMLSERPSAASAPDPQDLGEEGGEGDDNRDDRHRATDGEGDYRQVGHGVLRAQGGRRGGGQGRPPAIRVEEDKTCRSMSAIYGNGSYSQFASALTSPKRVKLVSPSLQSQPSFSLFRRPASTTAISPIPNRYPYPPHPFEPRLYNTPASLSSSTSTLSGEIPIPSSSVGEAVRRERSGGLGQVGISQA